MPAPRRKDYDEPAFRAAWMDPRLTIKDIARRYGVVPSCIHSNAMRRGFPPRLPYLVREAYDTPKVKEMWHDPNVSVREIADGLGVSVAAVSRAAKRRGWPTRYHVRAGYV